MCVYLVLAYAIIEASGHPKESCNEDGTSASPELPESVCNIERVTNLSLERFLEEFKNRKPVITMAANNSVFRQKCKREETLDSQIAVLLGSANSYTTGVRKSTLGEYVRQIREQDPAVSGADTTYLFGNTHDGPWTEYLAQYRMPPLALHSGEHGEATLSFGVGGRYSGVPFHSHGAGWSEVLWGAKHWFLYPRGMSPPRFDPDQSQLQWYTSVYPELENSGSSSSNDQSREETVDAFEAQVKIGLSKNLDSGSAPIPQLYECVIVPGEALYFPPMWKHAILNKESYTVFVSTFT